ncbi:MAG: GrpB family protein [bacterium]|nr:GrpB family protein [bacterium]
MHLPPSFWGHALAAASEFRELRGNEDITQAYAGHKRHLAVLHASDKAAYTEAKAPFIKRVLVTTAPPEKG